MPKPPLFKIFTTLIGDAFSIAIVSFALNISMAKLFAKKYNYHIRPNQVKFFLFIFINNFYELIDWFALIKDLFAYGIGNVFASFFNGFPSCVGLSRCVILEGTGAKTPLYALISSVIILIVIVGIGFLFKTLPIVKYHI